MSKPTIYGFIQSSYVMSARATAAVKGVDYTFEPMTPGQHKEPAHLARHPYGVVPGFVHGDVKLFESSAIAVYLDEAFEGVSLQPSSAQHRAEMWQWISVVNCYFYGHAVPNYILKYAFAGEGGPDRGEISSAVEVLKTDFAILSKGLGSNRFFVNDTLSLADLFVGPLLMGMSRLPEGGEMLKSNANLGRLVGALMETKGFTSILPPS